MLRASDRKLINLAREQVLKGRRAPGRLSLPLEATWAVVIAQNGTPVAQEVHRPGDTEDAVKRAWVNLANRAIPDELTIYLTLEPCAIHQRIPAVTESIRHTGIRRVVIGTEDPFLRHRGRGIAALTNYGHQVILADGEEARDCQLLYEDYAKAANRLLPLLRLVGRVTENDGRFLLEPAQSDAPLAADCLLHDSSYLYRGSVALAEGPWHVILDAHAQFQTSLPQWKRVAERLVVCVSEATHEKVSKELREKVAAIVAAPGSEDGLDLASVLRRLRDLGFASVHIPSGSELWLRAIRSGLVDRMLFRFSGNFQPTKTLGELAVAKVFVETEGGPKPILVRQPRLIGHLGDGAWIESEVTVDTSLSG